MTQPMGGGQSARVNSGNLGARQTARQREQAQSAPRPSRVRMNILVKGTGETRLKVAFNAYMMDEPTVSFGCIAKVPLKFGELPLATVTVVAWDKTQQGLYQGALVGFRIESNNFNIQMNVSLTFEGSALRSQSLGNTA